MFCKQCGKEIPEGTKFCPSCGCNQEVQDASASFKQKVEQPAIDVNQVINNLADKNIDTLSEGEQILAKAKWNIIPFALIWGIYFVILLIAKTYNPDYSYGYDFSVYQMIKDMLIELILRPVRMFFTPSIIIISIIVCALSIWLFIVRRELVVTNKKIYGRIGLIGTKTKVIPLSKINYIAVKHTIIGRLLGSGAFTVYPGTIFGVVFRFVANSEELKNAIEDELYKN